MDKIKWGILAPGGIARDFAADLQLLPDAELVAVGSRSKEKADKFGDEFGVKHCYGSYAGLVGDPDVDVIYISTLHPFHKECSLLALNAGKSVLCEKPFTINTAEAQEVIGLARSKKLFLMEAMVTPFIPVIKKVNEWISSGAIGEVRMLTASFGFRTDWDPIGDRSLNIALGGGALLDVGCYTLAISLKVFGGIPGKILSAAEIGKTGVDEQSITTLVYPEGKLASVSSAVRTNIPDDALILGTDGSIQIPHFWKPSKAILAVNGKEDETVEMAYEGNGYGYEASEAMRCIREGKTESNLWSLDDTLSIMKMMDNIRSQWGLVYPTEK